MTPMKAAEASLRPKSPPFPEKYPEPCSLPAKPLRPPRRRPGLRLPKVRVELRESAAPLCRMGRAGGLDSRPWKGFRVLSISCARKHGAAAARRLKRRLLSAALCAGFLFATDPAVALTRDEAARVAELIAALQPDFGPFAYDAEIVAEWFERDAADRGLIRASGFTAESWKTAVGDTFRGLAALAPQSEIDALRAKLDVGTGGLAALNAAQKAEALQALRVEFERMLAFRAEGARFADTVRPLAPRLKAILDTNSD